jgi:hypothetical protein
MGYRSEVKIVAGRKAADEIRTILAEHDSQLTEIGTNDQGETLFAADWAKWYEDDDDFPDVKAVMEVVDKYVYELSYQAKKLRVDQGLEYCRVGESDDDTDYRSNGAGGGYLSVGIRVHDEGGFKPADDEPKQLEHQEV